MLRIMIAGAVAALALLAAGCGSSASTDVASVERVAAASVEPGGLGSSQDNHAVAITSGDKTLRLDVEAIERAGVVRYAVDDPWRKKRVTYSGVLVSDLLRAIGAPVSTKRLAFRALDDYSIAIDAADAERWPIMLATRSDGRRMTIKDGGPTRIVFPYDLVPGIDEAHYNDLWIWNVASLELK